MHPEVFLSEKPPLRLSGWLERQSTDVSTPSGAEAWDQNGSAEGVAEEGAGNAGRGPGPGAEESAGDGREAGGSGEERVGRKAQEGALDDLVNMVAFGPTSGGEDRHRGACRNVLVCVLA